MSDYRLKITVKNARILRAIEAKGYRAGQKFCDEAGISYANTLLPYLNLVKSPVTRDGLIRDDAWDLCDFLGASPSDLWSDEQLTPIKKNTAYVDVGAERLRQLIGGKAVPESHEKVALLGWAHEEIDQILSSMPTRYREILKRKHILGETLEEVGEKKNISPERVRAIEKKAIWKLRENKTLKSLYESLGETE